MSVLATYRAPSGAKRIVDVARIQAVNGPLLFGTPLGVLALAFLINLAIFAALGPVAPPENRISGALMSIYLATGITHLQTMTQVFPFAVGLSATRRAFYAGTALVVTAQAAAFGLLMTLLERLEDATGGWGMQLQFFRVGFLGQDNLLLQWLVYTVPFLALSAIFMLVGVVFKRWGQLGVYVVTVGTGAVLGGLAVLVTWLQWWPAVGEFFAGSSVLGLLAGYPLVVALVLGAAGYLVIRRAIP